MHVPDLSVRMESRAYATDACRVVVGDASHEDRSCAFLARYRDITLPWAEKRKRGSVSVTEFSVSR